MVATTMKTMSIAKAGGPDVLPAELLEIRLQNYRTILLGLHRPITSSGGREKFHGKRNTRFHKKGDNTECGNYRISLVFLLFKAVT